MYSANKNLSMLNDDENKKGLDILSQLSSKSDLVQPENLVLLPGGGGTMGTGTFKRWSINKFIDASIQITKKYKKFGKIIFILGSNEKSYIDLIPKEINGIPVEIAFNVSINELATIALESRIAIANDCGPSPEGSPHNFPKAQPYLNRF